MKKRLTKDIQVENNFSENTTHFTYHSLMPVFIDTSSSSYNVYKKALDFAYKDSEIKNIAITGGYGVGKSSFLKTYFENNNRNIITVSISDFNNVGNESNNKIKTAEAQIINQILYQVSPQQIPLSKFEVKVNRTGIQTFIYMLFLMFLSIGVFSLFNDDLINFFYSEICKFENAFRWSQATIIIMLLIVLIMFSWWISKRLSPKIIRLNFKGTESEIMEKDDTEILDKEMREIVYLISSSGVDTVIFEDLDRFDEIAPFVRLREINSLVNFSSKNTIKFIYVVRDDLFESKDRTKFFDFMIPIIPTITTYNSPDKALKEFETVTFKIDSSVLKDIFIYIDDMRLIYSIKNEYEMYSKILGEEDHTTELFALIVLKNVFPREFADLENDRGYLYEILNQKERLIKHYEEILKDTKAEINQEMELEIENLIEYLLKFKPDQMVFQSSDKMDDIDFLKTWLKHKNDKRSIYSSRQQTYTFDEFIGEINKNTQEHRQESRFNYTEYDDLNSKIMKLENRLINLQEKIDQRNIAKMSTLLSVFGDEYLLMFFKEDKNIYNKTTENHYFPLIRFLVLEGYVDENYRAYNNYFYEGQLSKNDYDFIRNVKAGKTVDNNFKLYNIKEVMNYFEETDYSRVNIVNYDLLAKLIKDHKYTETTLMFNVILKNKDDLALNYLDQLNYVELKKLIKILLKESPSILEAVIQADFISPTLKMKIVSLAYKIPTFESTDVMNNYVAINSRILELNFFEDICSLLNAFNKFDIKFVEISDLKIPLKAYKLIAKKLMFELTLDNLMKILKEVNELNLNESEILSSLFSYLTNFSIMEVRDYVYENIQNIMDEYLERIFEKDININSNEDAFIKILNSDIEREVKGKMIKREQTIIQKISDVEDYNLWRSLFRNSLVKYDKTNLVLYHDKMEGLDKITEYFNKNYRSDIELTSLLYRDLLHINELDLNIFKSIAERFDGLIEELTEDLEIEKYHILIERDRVDFNLNNLTKVINKGQEELTEVYLHNGLERYGSKKVSELLLNDRITEIISVDLLQKILDLKILNETDSISLLQKKDIKVSLFKTQNASKEVREKILNFYFLDDELNKIIKDYDKFDLKELLIIKLNQKPNLLFDLKVGDISINFINILFESNEFSEKNKQELFIHIVLSKLYTSYWEGWLKETDFGSKISSVFSNGKPLRNKQNTFENDIVKTLIEEEIISEGNDNRLHLKISNWEKLLSSAKLYNQG